MKRASVWLLLLALTACSASARTKALRVSLQTLNTARAGFVQWDKQHQADIVKDAVTKDEGHVKLRAYRSRRQPIIEGFVVAYSALAAAALDTTVGRLAEAAQAVAAAYRLFKELRHEPQTP